MNPSACSSCRGSRIGQLTIVSLCVLLVLAPFAFAAGTTGSAGGRFYRLYWYEKGLEHGNPHFNARVRVNDPEIALNPRFMYRAEPRGNGMIQIRIEEDLAQLAAAELYLELWGGHPGTANKRVTINGRSQYSIPENGTSDSNCTHLYPALSLKLTDLVNGYNALQFACDKGSSFWGHFIVDNAALRLALKPDHPDLKKFGLVGFQAAVKATPAGGERESIQLQLSASSPNLLAIASVEYQGFYRGYAENGSLEAVTWHGFTKARQAVAVVAASQQSPFVAGWDFSMLQAQEDAAVQAIVHFKEHPELSYVTAPVRSLRLVHPEPKKVELITSKDLPKPFWSRAGRKNQCTLELATDPAVIEKAELHVVVWDGGAGTVKNYFTLNGHPLAVAADGKHDVIYSKLPIEPRLLRRGENRIELLSDTEHHGIEILLPGPALAVRSAK
ncbi:MAG: hypothetical protein L0387_23300 [Acidobacteria bacterium]|nr:hypothetical protein [Acidobacteriota bacterium]MCI0721385.1 hypothetical protein [Acidobacteriota bacterium]